MRSVATFILAAILASFPASPTAAAASGAAEPPLMSLSDGSRLELPVAAGAPDSPAAALGYPLGERFTHHAAIASYFERLAAQSDRVSLARYGSTYEGRPLLLAAVSSPGNIDRLEELRERHLKLADPEAAGDGEIAGIVASDPAFVWLAYGVHGNESSSAEAAMLAAWVLAADPAWGEPLEDVVVLIDPLVNPDGRERYVHSFESRRGHRADPSPLAAEHWEPWPGGRQNHYLVDLNRDWAWGTQTETRARLTAYRQWEPQVYVDFHEMWSDSTYFFPPSPEPILPQIDPRTVGWLDTFGRANAAAFDRHGWLYFVGESFDLYYPGYGDSYPALRGAVGMTYEMAGHGRAGSALERTDGSLLTLADRIARHYTTSLATVRTAAENRERLLSDYAASRSAAAVAPARSYLWEADQHEAEALARLLAMHGVDAGRLAEPLETEVTPLLGGDRARRRFTAGTFAVDTRQPLGGLVRSLMELDIPMGDAFIEEQRARVERNERPDFYDITAWSAPLAYNVETWVADRELGGLEPLVASHGPADGSAGGTVEGEGDVGYLIPPQGFAGYRAAARLQRTGVRYRIATEGFRLEGRDYPAGTLFVPTHGNDDGLAERIAGVASAVEVRRIATALSESGVSLGSNAVVPVRPARIGLLSGEGVGVTSFGFLWHLLDRQIEVDSHRLEVSTLTRLELDKLDVLVLPDGWRWRDALTESAVERLKRWVDGGGVLVAVGGAATWLAEQELLELATWEAPEDDGGEANRVVELTPANRPLYTPGAALATRLADHHPLALGLASAPPVLFQGTTILLPSGDPRQDVLVAAEEDPILAGFAWPEARERLRGALLVGVRERGAGAVVVFAQEPDYRLFWRGTAPLFLNAVMYGPSLLR